MSSGSEMFFQVSTIFGIPKLSEIVEIDVGKKEQKAARERDEE